MLTREETKKTDLTSLLAAVQVWTNKLISTALSLAISLFQSKETIETLSALEIAEQMTYLDHEIFISIRSEYGVLLFILLLIGSNKNKT